MHPILFKFNLPFIGEFPLHTFGVLVALGSFLAILYIRKEGERRGFDPEVLMGIAVETLLTGVAGSRVLFVLITPQAFAGKSWFSYLNIREGGLVWYGGLLPAAIFAIVRAKQLKLPWRTVADIIAPAVMLGLAVGRVGCLMAGDDHGKPVPGGVEHWWTLTFKPIYEAPGILAPMYAQPLVNDVSYLNVPLYPSQPLMGIGAFTIFLICHALRKKLADRPTAVMFLMFTLYAVHRFLVEFTRGDKIRGLWEVPVFGQLSTSQMIGIPIFFTCGGILVWLLMSPARGVEPPPPPSTESAKDAAPASAPPAPPTT